MSTLAVLQTATTTWNLDPTHSVAEFKVKHMMICNVEGHFGTVTGALILDETDRTNSSVEASRDGLRQYARCPARYTS